MILQLLPLIIILEIIATLLLIIGFIFEDHVIAFENQIIKKIFAALHK